jgi:flagellar protein FlaF
MFVLTLVSIVPATKEDAIYMHTHGAMAYQQTAKTVESPREREAALLIKAAGLMQRAKDTWNDGEPDWSPALTYNRKIWTVFVSSVTRDDNPLPAEIRQNIANLGIFMLSQTRSMMVRPEPHRLDAMININRQLAAGLRGQ